MPAPYPMDFRREAAELLRRSGKTVPQLAAELGISPQYRDIRQGEPVDTFARSKFEDTRRKAARFGAMGSTIRATQPRL